jgi:hypothetical protein
MARGCALGVIAASLATVAHVLGGGELPPPSLLLLTGSLAVALGVALSGSRMGRARVVAIVVGGQLLLHELLMMLVAVDAADPLRQQPMPGMPGMTVPLAAGSAPSSAVWSMLAHHAITSVTTVPGATMLAAHTLAAVLVGLWLAAGERLIWSLLELVGSRRLGTALMALVRALGATGRDSEAVHDRLRAQLARRLAPPWRSSTWFLARAAVRRGPPAPNDLALT